GGGIHVHLDHARRAGIDPAVDDVAIAAPRHAGTRPALHRTRTRHHDQRRLALWCHPRGRQPRRTSLQRRRTPPDACTGSASGRRRTTTGGVQMNVATMVSTRIRVARATGYATWAALAILQVTWHA